jgi:TrmH RNA methyltransferase
MDHKKTGKPRLIKKLSPDEQPKVQKPRDLGLERPQRPRPDWENKPKVRNWDEEQIVSGFNAVMAVLQRRPGSVLRLFFTDDLAPRFGFACKQLAADRKIYRTVSNAELEKLAKSPHHEGVVAITAARVVTEPSVETIMAWNAEKSLVLVLDQIQNSHNMGAMVRTAAFLGVKDILMDRSAFATLTTPSATRVAEGGLEEVRLWQVDSLADFLTLHASKLWIVGTDQNAKETIAQAAKSPRRNQGASLMVMGSEEEGLSPEIRALCHNVVTIPGAGVVESLNVVQATAICLYVFAQSDLSGPAPMSVQKKRVVRKSGAAGITSPTLRVD